MANYEATLCTRRPNPVGSKIVTIGLVFFAMSAVGQEPKVETMLETWRDAKRDHNVPVKIYLPSSTDATKKLPVIIFSHGLGGSREGYEFVGEHWAMNGFVSVHIQHIGSDNSVWKDVPKAQIMSAMRKAAGYKQFVARPADVSFVLDELERHETLKARLDFDRIGMAGHSFGGHTTLAVSGQVFPTPFGKERSFGDDRIKAAIAMSPQAPKKKSIHDVAFSRIKIPVMHLTGTLDRSPLDPDFAPADRQIPFQKIEGAAQYLIVFENGNHMIFSGRGRGPRDKAAISAKELATFHEHIKSATLAFWKAWLNDDEEVRLWLKSETGLKTALGTSAAIFNSKN